MLILLPSIISLYTQTFQIRCYRKLAPLHVLEDIYCLKRQFVTFHS